MAKQESIKAKKEKQVPAKQKLARKYSKDKTKCMVTFWLPKEAAPDAGNAAVAGIFNNWDQKSHLMNKLESGDFTLGIELEAVKEHEFRFIIDGIRWENAWNADKYVWSDNGNCENSVVIT